LPIEFDCFSDLRIFLALMKGYFKQLRTDLDRLFAARAEHGPYRYLIKNWKAISDINLAAEVLSADVFRRQLEPVALPVENIRSFLVIAPHQDDEVIGAGGTLALASKARARLDLLFVTDGDQVIKKSAGNGGAWTAIRRAEAKAVCGKLNAACHELNISNINPQPNLSNVVELNRIIRETRPEVVLCPWLLDSPSKHRMANHLLFLANAYGNLPDFEVWSYQVHNSLIPNGVVDITATAGEKRALIKCYKSQTENLYRYDHQAMGIAAWNSRYLGRDDKKRYAEIFFTLPKLEYLELIERFYLKNLRETYLGNSALIDRFEDLDREILLLTD
jgi:LmbE family N-acetylglucosaminyl deacetylase